MLYEETMMQAEGPPTHDYIAVGHITHDLVGGSPKGFAYGGTSAFAALTAKSLGYHVALISAHRDEPAIGYELDGIEVLRLESDETTTFENIYTKHGRVQRLHAVASPIEGSNTPPGWLRSPLIHLAPVAREISLDLLNILPETALVGATPQGWLRTWTEDGWVRPSKWHDIERYLERIDALVFSIEDVDGDRAKARRYAEMARLAVITEDKNGCTVWANGNSTFMSAFDVEEVDPTGAGDAFAAAFFLELLRTQDPIASAHFANCVASFIVEAAGHSSLPNYEQISRRLHCGKLRASL